MPIPTIMHGDCRDVIDLLAMTGEQFDAVVTDPPYHLTSVVERFGKPGSAPAKPGTDGAFARASRGFMGKEWDGGDIAFTPDLWAAVLEVMKPGAHLVAFGGSRGYHRMACAIEDAGFEIRDSLMWLYGTGFPKSHDFAADDKDENGARVTKHDFIGHSQAKGFGTALKPAFEPIVLAQKPFKGTIAANVLAHGCGGINIDGCRIDPGSPVPGGGGLKGGALSRHEGWSRPAHLTNEATEPHTLGRFPANVLHDGSDEVMAAFAAFGESKSSVVRSLTQQARDPKSKGAEKARVRENVGHSDSGSAARFFYSAKASKADRAGSQHPTVKPLSLMRWLCTLVTPPGGRILDPFAGSGSTLQAAHECGFGALGIEREAEYLEDIRRRISLL